MWSGWVDREEKRKVIISSVVPWSLAETPRDGNRQPNVGDLPSPLSRSAVGVYQKRLFGKNKERENKQTERICGDVDVCEPYVFCEERRPEVTATKRPVGKSRAMQTSRR